jgi:hypothetical protein
MIKYFGGIDFKGVKVVGAELQVEKGQSVSLTGMLIDYGTAGFLYERIPQKGETDRIYWGSSLNFKPLIGFTYVSIEGKSYKFGVTVFGKDFLAGAANKEVI